MRIKSIIGFITFLIISPFSEAKLTVEELLSDGRKQSLLSSDSNTTEGFFSIQSNYKVYGGYFLFDSNSLNKWEIVSKDEGIDLSSNDKGSYLVIGTKSTSQILLKNNEGRERKLIVNWVPREEKILTQNCGAMAPKFVLNNNSNELPQKQVSIADDSLFAVHCRLKNKKLFMTVSTTIDVQWSESTIFESDGKGERWRDYQIPAWTSNGGIIAEVRLKKNEIEKVHLLVAPKSQEIQKKEEIQKIQEKSSTSFENEFKIFSNNLNFNADDINSTDSKIGVSYGFLSPRYFDLFKLGGSFLSTLEISKKTDSLNLMELLLYGGYNQTFVDSLDLGVYLVYQYGDFQQKSTSARMQNSQFGIRLNTSYLFTPDHKIKFDIYKTSFSSAVLKDQLAYELGYYYNLKDYVGSLWLGFFVKDQKFKLSNELGLSRFFGEKQMGVVLAF